MESSRPRVTVTQLTSICPLYNNWVLCCKASFTMRVRSRKKTRGIPLKCYFLFTCLLITACSLLIFSRSNGKVPFLVPAPLCLVGWSTAVRIATSKFSQREEGVYSTYTYTCSFLCFFLMFLFVCLFWKLKLIPGLKKETSFLELFPKSVMGNNIDWKSIFAPDDDDGIVGYTAKASQA